MINPKDKLYKVNKYISLFNIELGSNEEDSLLIQLGPVLDLLYAHSQNSLYIYKSGGLYHCEALVRVSDKYGNSNSVGCSLEDSLQKIIPKILSSTSEKNLFPRNRQITLKEQDEVSRD